MTDIDGAFLRIARQYEYEADAPPVIPPCPSWCVSTAALHTLEFDTLEDGVYVRRHEPYAGRIVNVEAVERSDGQGGAVSLSEPTVRLYGADYDGVNVSSEDVRSMAAELLEAAAIADRIGARL